MSIWTPLATVNDCLVTDVLGFPSSAHASRCIECGTRLESDEAAFVQIDVDPGDITGVPLTSTC